LLGSIEGDEQLEFCLFPKRPRVAPQCDAGVDVLRQSFDGVRLGGAARRQIHEGRERPLPEQSVENRLLDLFGRRVVVGVDLVWLGG